LIEFSVATLLERLPRLRARCPMVEYRKFKPKPPQPSATSFQLLQVTLQPSEFIAVAVTLDWRLALCVQGFEDAWRAH